MFEGNRQSSSLLPNQGGEPICPSGVHFHLTADDANGGHPLRSIIECDLPEDALRLFLPSLPMGWEGSVSVDDHESLHPSEMPLLETWYEKGISEATAGVEHRDESNQVQLKDSE
jgi:hypothetical protein